MNQVTTAMKTSSPKHSNISLRQRQWTSFRTLVLKEIQRFMRIWQQTLLPSVISMTLYFLIFGHVIGRRVGSMQGIPYIDYIAPGLIMMAVITNSYDNVVSSLFGSRFQHSIEELLISPLPNYGILFGFICGSLLRAIIVAAGVTVVTLFFTDIHVKHISLTLATMLLSSLLFSLGGFMNAMFAKTFDDISVIPIFVLTPLTFLGGVFYSVSALPPFWQHVSHLNPILYMVNTFRYGILGVSDINIHVAFTIIITTIVALFSLNLFFLSRGTGMRS